MLTIDDYGLTEEELSKIERLEHRLPNLSEEEYDLRLAEASQMELPFDLQNTLSTNPFVYDYCGEKPTKLGEMVKYTGGPVNTLDGDELTLNECIGVIVGYEFGRAVIAFENEEHGWVYLGWVNPEDFHQINIFHENTLWTH